MEFVLKNYTHYFTDIDEMGGEIFDMLSWLSRGRRLFLQGSSLSRCVINIASIEKRELCSSNAVLEVLKEREQGWLLQASGDLLSKKLREDHEREAVDIEQCLYRSQKREVSGVKWCWHLLQSFHKKIVESCL
jgi:hypothetical protein